MSLQPTLFDLSHPDTPPCQAHSSTSREAASAIKPALNELQERVLAFLRGQGLHGATDEEIQGGLVMQASTERPRRVELVAAGVVKDSGCTRKTKSGRKAVVWVVV